jgi:hypothetical protein
MNTDEFREYGRKAFQFLTEKYGFRECTSDAYTNNEYSVCFSNGITWIGVCGVSWGSGVDVRLASCDPIHMRYRTYSFQDLLDIRSPNFPLPKVDLSDMREIQKRQMDWYAAALKVHAKDVLRGDFTIFPQLAEAITIRGGQPDR